MTVRYMTTAQAGFSPPVAPAVTITPFTFAAAVLGTPITPVALAATGGVSPYTWSVSNLPAGVTLSGNTISGTPNAAGTSMVSVTVTDSTTPTALTQTITRSLVVTTVAATGVAPNQMAGGLQCMNNDCIFNLNIASAPLHPQNSLMMGTVGGSTASVVGFETIDGPHHVIPIGGYPLTAFQSAPTVTMDFLYTPGSNSNASNNYQFNPTTAGFSSIEPFAGRNGTFIESGNYSVGAVDTDRKWQNVSVADGSFSEFYNAFPPGQGQTFAPSGFTLTATMNAIGGVYYKQFETNMAGTGASGTPAGAVGNGSASSYVWIIPCMPRPDELRAGEIRHPVTVGLSQVVIAGHANTTVGPYLWPATATSYSGAGNCPYGTWFRLKAGTTITLQGANSVTAGSTVAISSLPTYQQIMIRQLQEYGMILADGTSGGDIGSLRYSIDCTLDPNMASAMSTFPKILWSEFEVIDVSSLKTADNNNQCNPSNSAGIAVPPHQASPAVAIGVTHQLIHVAQGVAVNLASLVLPSAQAATFAFWSPIAADTATGFNQTAGGVGTLSGSTFTASSSAVGKCIIEVTLTANPVVKTTFIIVVIPWDATSGLRTPAIGGTYVTWPYTTTTATAFSGPAGTVWHNAGLQAWGVVTPYAGYNTVAYSVNNWTSLGGVAGTDTQPFWLFAIGNPDLFYQLYLPAGSYDFTVGWAYDGANGYGNTSCLVEIDDTIVEGAVNLTTGAVTNPLVLSSVAAAATPYTKTYGPIAVTAGTPVRLAFRGYDVSLQATRASFNCLSIVPTASAAAETLPAHAAPSRTEHTAKKKASVRRRAR